MAVATRRVATLRGLGPFRGLAPVGGRRPPTGRAQRALPYEGQWAPKGPTGPRSGLRGL